MSWTPWAPLPGSPHYTAAGLREQLDGGQAFRWHHQPDDGTWLGHGGYGGQFMLANPDTGTAVVYFSVLENKDAYDTEFQGAMVRMMADVAAL